MTEQQFFGAALLAMVAVVVFAFIYVQAVQW
jgi:hypothetical protein